MTSRYQDSTGQPIAAGDHVIYRGELFTIQTFMPECGRGGVAGIALERSFRDSVQFADECSVDKVVVIADVRYRGARIRCLNGSRYCLESETEIGWFSTVRSGAIAEACDWFDAYIARLPLDLRPLPEERPK